ncbi:MAG TPA: hypothetical protein VF179_00945 [Thermoanaerobaculia bacterium]|nr:hypothetical protein [Thermoanaerobaculia bacterium]
MRSILANLLCEDELAKIRRTPSRETLQTVSGLATLLRVFAREGDRLWTPAAVDPERVLPVPGLPILESGPIEPTDELLAWCETPQAAALRKQPRSLVSDLPLHELLWHLPTAPPSIVAKVHHRAFHLQVAEELGCALPGARMVESLAELDRILPSSPSAWVVKAPLSASGRSRYIERKGPLLSDPKSRRTVERLFEGHGPLLFEPWMERTADFGCSALLTESELRIVGFHRQMVDIKGQFAGIELPAEVPEIPVEGVAAALRREGYVGPFGIDAWSYRNGFNPLGEINARMTFGLVAWALAERLGIERLRLRFGAEAPAGAIPLLAGSPSAWIEIL